MSLNLKDRLRIELARDAERGRLISPEWSDQPTVRVQHSSPARWLPAMTKAAALAAVLAGGAAVLAVRTGDTPTVASPPPGREYRLTEVPTDELPLDAWTDIMSLSEGRVLVNPDTFRASTAPGINGWLITYDTPMYNPFAGALETYRCSGLVPPNGRISSGCTPPLGLIDFSSSGDRGDNVTWSNVPAGTAYVGYVDGAGEQWWQRPVGPLAQFPRNGELGQMTAYADDGTTLLVVDEAVAEQSRIDVFGPYPQVRDMDSLSDGQREELSTLAQASLRTCFDKAGATYPNGPSMPVLPGDSAASWQGCVESVAVEVDQKFASLNGHLVPQTPGGSATLSPTTTATEGTGATSAGD